MKPWCTCFQFSLLWHCLLCHNYCKFHGFSQIPFLVCNLLYSLLDNVFLMLCCGHRGYETGLGYLEWSDDLCKNHFYCCAAGRSQKSKGLKGEWVVIRKICVQSYLLKEVERWDSDIKRTQPKHEIKNQRRSIWWENLSAERKYLRYEMVDAVVWHRKLKRGTKTKRGIFPNTERERRDDSTNITLDGKSKILLY